MSSNFTKKLNITIPFAQSEFTLDGRGSLFWPRHELLVVADLHLEKASFLANYGQPLPLYDTRDTLKRLELLIKTYKPKNLLTLGDNFHDISALIRIKNCDLAYLKKIASSVEQWIWIIGNHDENLDFSIVNNLSLCHKYILDDILFTHQLAKTHSYQILGHYHPKVWVKKISGKCFVVSKPLIILPAFGSFTGGLDVCSSSFQKIISPNPYNIYMLFNEKIWQVQ